MARAIAHPYSRLDPKFSGGLSSFRRSQALSADGNLIEAMESGRPAQEGLERQISDMRDRLAAYEVLLREADHRVKNALQLVGSMLALHARQVSHDPARRILDAARQRVLSIASIHEQIYRCSHNDHIELGQFLHGLCTNLAHNKPDNISSLVVRADPMPVPQPFAVKLGTLLCELVTNAFKHAYPAGHSGTVRVDLKRLDEGCRLTVDDDGVGFPPEFPNGTTTGFGERLIKSVVTSIGATVKRGSGPGSQLIVDVPNLVQQQREQNGQPSS